MLMKDAFNKIRFTLDLVEEAGNENLLFTFLRGGGGGGIGY